VLKSIVKANAAGEVEGQHDAGAYLEMGAVCERWILEEQSVDSLDIPAIYSDRTVLSQVVRLDFQWVIPLMVRMTRTGIATLKPQMQPVRIERRYKAKD
jgi:hypothetical protein